MSRGMCSICVRYTVNMERQGNVSITVPTKNRSVCKPLLLRHDLMVLVSPLCTKSATNAYNWTLLFYKLTLGNFFC